MKTFNTFHKAALISVMMLAGTANAQMGGMGNMMTPPILTPQMQRDMQQAGTIQHQMQQDAQKQQEARWKLQQEIQKKIFEVQQDVTTNKVKTADKAFNAMDSYIRSAPPIEYKLFTYEEFLTFPTFRYSASHQNEMSWLYAPQGEAASRGGLSGADAVPWLSLRGWGTQASLGGIQGSLGGLYPLLAELYAPGREFNPTGAKEMSELASRAGIVTPSSIDMGKGIMLDPALRQAIADGSLFNTIHGQPIQLVTLPTASSGGLANVAIILPLSFKIFDFGLEDGDNITLTVIDQTGQRYHETFSLTNAGDIISPVVVAGQVELRVHANNEGYASPNTGQINILSTVTAGPSVQQFNLQTGETGSMVITAGPAR